MKDITANCRPSFWFNPRSLLMVITASAIFVLATLVLADEDDPPASQPLQNQQKFRIAPELLDQLVFDGLTEAQATKRIEDIANQQIKDIDQIFTISDAQTEKLRLAAKSDIKQFCDRYEVFQQHYQNVPFDPQDENSRMAIRTFHMQWQGGVFGDESLFHKVLYSTLQRDQKSVYEYVMPRRVQARYKSSIRSTVPTLSLQLSLTDSQRQQFEMLLQTTPAPESYGQIDYCYIMAQVAKLPDEQLRLVFDAKQLGILRQLCRSAKAHQVNLNLATQ